MILSLRRTLVRSVLYSAKFKSAKKIQKHNVTYSSKQKCKTPTTNYKPQTTNSMCNCGNKRSSLSQQKSEAPKSNVRKPIESTTPNANFEYTGKTALTVVGNVTGKNYRFSYTGDIQIVDHRDAPGMKMIPVLKRIYS